MSRSPRPLFLASLLGLLLFASGCITRTLTVKSDPPGALVDLNDQEVGRTPFTKEFLWYGEYDVVLRKEGYETLKTDAQVPAPWWQWIPLDLFTDMLPLRDDQLVSYKLTPLTPEGPAKIMARAEEMQGMLESSKNTKTRLPSTRPTTRATTQKIK